MSERLPNGWAGVQLEELILLLESGNRPKGGVRGIREGVPSLGGEHLNIRGGFNFSNTKYVPLDFFNKMNKGHIQIDDILIVKDGATTGKTSLITNEFPYKKAVINEHVFLLRCSKTMLSSFLFRYLWSKEGQRKILANFQGAAQGGINRKFISNTLVPLPPINEQQRIAAKLDHIMPRIDGVKERLERIPQIIKRFRQAVLTAAVTGKLTEKWREEHPDVENTNKLLQRINDKIRKEYYKKFNNRAKKEGEKKPFNHILKVEGKFNNTPLPASWTLCFIKNIYNVETGATPLRTKKGFYDNGKIPWIKSGDVLNSEINASKEFITELALNETNVKIFPKNTLIIAMYGEGKTRGQIGWLNFPATTNQACAALVNNCLDLIIKKYTFLFILSQYNEIRKESAGGNQPNLNLQKIKNWALPFPPLEEQREIVRQVDKLFSFADKLEEHYKKAKEKINKLPQSVLAKAFRGELVPQDPNDEPASVLLERIKAEREKQQAAKPYKKRNSSKRRKAH